MDNYIIMVAAQLTYIIIILYATQSAADDILYYHRVCYTMCAVGRSRIHIFYLRVFEKKKRV